MRSVALNHFPRYVFRKDSKLLWNPILKKSFIDRPEERVRLQLVDYLILEAGFSTSRISFESPVHLPNDKSSSRTDVICFDKEFKPTLLIECKAPEIALNEKASLQIARYNQEIEAPFLLISNGIEDFWFSKTNGSISSLGTIPSKFEMETILETDLEYWIQRGFAGAKSHPDARKWIKESCEDLYKMGLGSSLKYFKFEGVPLELYMANYYRIFQKNESIKLALSLTSTPFGATKMNGVLNVNGSNKVLISTSLDLIANNDSKNTVIQFASKTSRINLSDKMGFDLEDSITDQAPELMKFLSSL